MKSNKKKDKNSNEDDDYIIDNDQEIIEYDNSNNNNNFKSNLMKEDKNQKASNKNKTSNWIKEAKAEYQKERNKNNINKKDSRTMNNNRKQKKIINYDDIPVGGGMGIRNDFSVEIKVPQKKNYYMQNNSFNENNIQFRNENILRQNLENKTDFIKPKRTKNNLDENNINNNNINSNSGQVEMERKSSMTSMVTQTCDKEMLGRSEFIGIPMNQDNNEINYSNNKERLANKQNYSFYDKQDNFSKVSTNNFDASNFTNKISDFNINSTQNIREKTETAIQLQNVQRELDNEIEMNKRLQGQIENYKSEFNNLREELVKKSDIINELQQKISKLEKELFLQGNQLIEAEAKPSQEHYEDIVNNYEEMKKNFDKAIERIKFLSDENEELKETILRYEENNKKPRKTNRLNREKIGNEKKNKNNIEKNDLRYENKEEEEDYQNENKEEDIYMEQAINQKNKNINKNIQEENEKEINDNENEDNEDEILEEKKQVKNSIIPEDNDIFGTKNNENKNKSNRKPRKIQEDGIPVIKRMEEKDNVKDIMINNYAANDDMYYNRPPIGKPKVKRIKRNNDLENNSQEQTSKLNEVPYEYLKKKKEHNIEENQDEEVKNNEKIDNDNDKFKNRFNNKRKNNLNNITTNVGVFPSQLKVIANEREILNLESQLFNLQKERDLVNDEYLKYPEYPKKREEINAKRKVEIKLEEMNKEISLQKLKIRELKNKK